MRYARLVTLALCLALLLPVSALADDVTQRYRSNVSPYSYYNVVFHDNGDGTYSQTVYSSGGTFSITLPAANLGQRAMAASLSVVPASDITARTYIGNVDLPATVTVKLTPTITAGAYTAKDCLGGKLTITNAVPANGGSAVLVALSIADLDNEAPALDLYFSDTDFATAVNDNDALDLADADLPNVKVVSVSASDYKAAADNAVATIRNISLPFKAGASTRNLYLYVQINDGDTFTATSDIRISLDFLPN